MSPVNRIRGYLPVRLQLPSENGTRDETFIYVKEHTEKASNKSTTTTLFVVNAPVIPGVSTRILLKALLGAWADIQRVTVVSHATRTQVTMTPTWLTKNTEGSYAHVIYASPQALKKTMKALEKRPELALDGAEVSTLQDASADDDEEEKESDQIRRKSGNKSIVLELAKRYRQSIPDRNLLLEECNQVMEKFEETSEALRMERERAANEPDEDGFVTVTYTGNNNNVALESSQQNSGNKRPSSKSSRHRKKQKKKCEDLTDFYRFQNKQQKKDALQELRKQFQHDVEKVQKLRENFHPF
ncbi:hypothetical protein FisN_19Hh012 [Fistulifera solaris]|jgi:hypothetical protein|uniref:Ribosomal RNA-processing protein 7 C-terminal domain-containing protein n=1 Tax=Fistulifera solaris TaxID=1519565 RepID=A0A1Z5K0B9_FISSO|nr:hypothetical protein FisN_19Hh012 [Fistulifera solaris]|eukprot:GAX19441.1 hypothetical protein FisN_19Hh012 [Fistulifera solaris]